MPALDPTLDKQIERTYLAKYNLIVDDVRKQAETDPAYAANLAEAEQFLLDLVKEVKLQSSGNIKFFKDITKDFSDSVSKTMSEHTTPYLENILYSLNKLNENIVKSSGCNSDIVDKLF